ncbi:MAG: amidohydrolase [Tindallia sp. MSAO_Bac2]|nr:MAG: amidohydrolase [Tindallia sp. MSAO_Bac2]
MNWSFDVDALTKKLTEYRRDLHQIPELAFQENETAAYIQKRLDQLGIQYESGVAGTGILAFIPGNPGTDTYCFRADMDALEVDEQNDVEYKSRKSGCMHACGHDGHMTVLLGLANILVSEGVKLRDNVVLLFQPGEEGTGGADIIVQSGILDQYDVRKIYGLHLFPGIEEGMLGIASGPMMAQNSEIDITIWGENAHGGLPHSGNDALIVASQLLATFQTIISRNINPLEPAVITFGRMNGGEVRNMIARKATMEGTIRTFSEESYEILKNRLLAIVRGLEITYECQIDIDLRELYPPVINPPEMVQEWMSAQEEDLVEITEPIMLAEDFSFYQRKYPSLFFFLGTRSSDENLIHPLHHGRFNYNETVLAVGVQAFLNILLHQSSVEINPESERA